MEFEFEKAQGKIGVEFKNKSLLVQAFTHSSYANENKAKSNERLEFLGDSILGMIVTEAIYSQTKFNEGDLSKLRALIVSEEPLSKVIDELGLEELMLKGVGESKNKVSSKAIKCDLFEAIVGAIYIDQGLEVCKEFILRMLKPTFDEAFALDGFEDSKTRLQEKFAHARIRYETLKRGPEHNPYYHCVVFVNGVACGEGKAGTKKASEQMAASMALEGIKNI
ncbi:MAG: ribonuclease III [Clostridia bacterium]|nr:ribonuclease III [Clostridia bacterium]